MQAIRETLKQLIHLLLVFRLMPSNLHAIFLKGSQTSSRIAAGPLGGVCYVRSFRANSISMGVEFAVRMEFYRDLVTCELYMFSIVECGNWTFGIGCLQSCICNQTTTERFHFTFILFSLLSHLKYLAGAHIWYTDLR